MSPSPDEARALADGEALQRCLAALDPLRPNYDEAQVYALLAVEQTLRRVALQLDELGGQITRGLRRL
jgi:hypothetical protein